MITQPARAVTFAPDELDQLSGWVVGKRALGNKIVFTNGCFDMLHAGHVCLLQTAACRHGDIVVVGVNTDEGVRRLKGPTRPILSYEDRVFLLSSLRFVALSIARSSHKFLRQGHRKPEGVGHDVQ